MNETIRQKLFNLLDQEHGIIALESELDEIIHICNDIRIEQDNQITALRAEIERLKQGAGALLEKTCSCSKGKGIDFDEAGKAYCIDCGKFLV